MAIQSSHRPLLGHRLSGLLNLAQDIFTLGFPDITLRILVAVGKIGDDRISQLLDGAEAALGDHVRRSDRAKKRSTRLSQDEDVGVKCMWKRGRLRQPGFDLRVLVGCIVVGDQVDSRAPWASPGRFA